MKDLLGFLQSVPLRRRAVAFLAVANLAGALYGFEWYRAQLARTHPLFWPFVPDSPLSTLLFSLVLLGLVYRRRLPLLEGVAYVWIVKYGSWSVLVIGHFWLTHSFGGFELTHLFLSHSIMALQGLWFAYHYFPGIRVILGGAALAGLNDAVDYLLGHHPALPGGAAQLDFARGSALLLTLLATLLLLWLGRRGQDRKDIPYA